MLPKAFRLAALAMVAGANLFAGVSLASAQGLPEGPIRLVNPYSPGSAVDFAIRLIMQRITESGGPTVILEHKAGGSGVIAAMAVKQSPPDGRVLFLCDLGTFGVNVSLVPNLPYDPLTDFKAVVPLWVFPSVLAVPASLPANSIPELVALAKRTPGGLNYASQGIGSGGHIRGEIFAKVSGAPFVHVPYRGGAPAVNDLVAGRVAFLMGSYSAIQGQVEGKLLKVIGTSASRRLPIFPDIPTLGESGYPEVDLESWFGLAAPAGTPDTTIQALNALFGKAAMSQEVESKLVAQGVYGMAGSPEKFAALIKADIARLRPIVEGLAKQK